MLVGTTNLRTLMLIYLYDTAVNEVVSQYFLRRNNPLRKINILSSY